MSIPITVAPRSDVPSFLGFPLCMQLDSLEADIAILGIPYGRPYGPNKFANDQSNAPAAVRRASARISDGLDHYRTYFPDRHARAGQCAGK
jgi:agmatinase